MAGCPRVKHPFAARLPSVLLPKEIPLDSEPGRTSRACGIRLSQNKQNTALQASVNKNARIFARSGSLPTYLGEQSPQFGLKARPSLRVYCSGCQPKRTCSAFHHQLSTFCDLLITYFTFVAAG